MKHPQVQCQLTIVSSKKISRREAIDLVYRALALEGFAAVESSNSILIVPEGKEPKMGAELVGASRGEIPEGRQRLLKVFSLKHVQAADLKERIRGVLSDKATIDTDDRANQIIVTDYNDNLRLLEKLVGELDVASGSDSVVRIYSLKHADAEELGNLLSLVINAQAATSSGSQGRSSSPPGGGPHPASSGPATVVGGGVALLRAGQVLAAGPLETTLTAASLSACIGLDLALERRGGRWFSWLPGPG